MIYFKDGKYELSTPKIIYTQKNVQTSKYVGEEGLGWRQEFEKVWPEMKTDKIEADGKANLIGK